MIANKKVDIKFSMLEASNRFKDQGRDNPNGWGVGWYENGISRLEKYSGSAFKSGRFDSLVKELESRIIIAHVRLASVGKSDNINNAHPFLYKNWLFAHNGTIWGYKQIQEMLVAPYNEHFTSEPIDSEIYFRFLIQNIEKEGNRIDGIRNAVKKIIPYASGANFILTDGKYLYGFRYGNKLNFLFREPSLLNSTSKETGALIESKRLEGEKAVLIASERLTDEDWEELQNGELLIISPELERRREILLKREDYYECKVKKHVRRNKKN
ncbi:MAG: class II glutamine amidotransferase [Candidatus Omnitrophica bacterium]|nr:class II glutamine amidotransferase [Candidatus Omnitrophota bacterium]